ncbi:putative quinol monooxygenase [Litchfieldia salsa]|uniref:Quinol monooxygenase YgiN n=1 Tax=Litchfieldia salsa TaxID=930152 RepID=A0A1H0SQ51_9BACI|nr:antibiotic biosynthesis monooxygenase [Litchfieldia salsa]SDP43844.1 Quinol monooxygenase YgiN [Litchfieldia salsa]
MKKFGLFNKLTAREGKRDELAKILVQASKSMEELDDCDLYVISLGNESSDSIYVYEVWVDENAHQASLSQEVFQSLIQQAKPIIAGMEKVNTLSPLGGKGISTFPRD